MSNSIYFEVYRKLSCSHCSVYSLDCLVAAIVHEKQWLFYTLCNRDREISWSNDPGEDLRSWQRVTHPGYTRLSFSLRIGLATGQQRQVLCADLCKCLHLSDCQIS